MMSPRARSAGFTLIEVVLALAVLALALAAIIQASGSAARNVAYLQDKTFAHWVAQNRMNALRLAREWPAPGTSEGSERMADRAWRWEIKVSNTPEAQLRRVDIRVRREGDPAETSLALLTGFLSEALPDALGTPTGDTPNLTQPATESITPAQTEGQPAEGAQAQNPTVTQ